MKEKTKTIYQKNLIKEINERTGLSKDKSRKFLSAFKQSIIEALSNDESVRIKSFGTFDVKTMPARLCYSIKHKGMIVVSSKNVVRFKKSKAWELPLPKKRKTRTANTTNFEKKNVPYSLRRRSLDCDNELMEFYRQLTTGKTDCYPYIWKLKIKENEYVKLKGLLSWASEEYEDEGYDSKDMLKKHANLMAIYIAEWYKRDYKNNRGDENNDALRDIGLSGHTTEYYIVWQYSSPAFDIEKFLYRSNQSNRTKHSLYILGGIPLQFESKKLRAIIFNTLNKKNEDQQNEDNEENENEKSEDEAFLIDNIYLRESLIRENGSLHLFVNELKNGTYFENLTDNKDYEQFLQTFQVLQQAHFSRHKFRSEWIFYYRKGCGLVERALRIHLCNEFSNESDPLYISDYRLKKWNVPTDELADFDILLRMNNGMTRKLFHFSYTDDNCYTCTNRTNYKTLDNIPFDFKTGKFLLRSNDTGEEYEILEKDIVFDDVMRLFKTVNEYEWTDSSYINSTETAILCSNQYEPMEQEIAETLFLGEGENRKSFYWIPFENSITIKHVETGEETLYTSKVGRISIRLKQHRMGTLQNTVPKMEIEMRKTDGEYKNIPIFRKNTERYSKDFFIFEEYDQQRGLLKCRNLEREDDVNISITQNGKNYSYPLGLSSLSYGVFTIKCTKQTHSSTFTAFCIEDSNDIIRNLEENTYQFSVGLNNALGGIWPINTNIYEIRKCRFKENLSIDSGNDAMLFSSIDGLIRIPVFRVSKKAYVAFIKGTPKVVPHNSNSRIPILHIPKSQQADITRINLIDKDGVRGIDISEVVFRNTQLIEVCHNGVDGYPLAIPDYDKNKYQFICYNAETEYIGKVVPIQIRKSEYFLKCKKGNIVTQFIDNSNEPNYLFRFVNNILGSELQWLLGLDEKEEIACKRLSSFLYAYYWYKMFDFTKSDYDFLQQIADELRFDWMFLFPKVWKPMVEKDEKLRDVLYNLFVSRNPNNDYAKDIAKCVLNGFDKEALWVNHRIDRNKDNIGFKAVELFMPIHVQKGLRKTSPKHVNNKNADKFREVDLDPKNITVVREVSFTGNLRDEKFVDEFLNSLNEEDAYEEIYNYMKQYKLL